MPLEVAIRLDRPLPLIPEECLRQKEENFKPRNMYAKKDRKPRGEMQKEPTSRELRWVGGGGGGGGGGGACDNSEGHRGRQDHKRKNENTCRVASINQKGCLSLMRRTFS